MKWMLYGWVVGLFLYLSQYPYHWWVLQWVGAIVYLTGLLHLTSFRDAVMFSGLVGAISHLYVLRGVVAGPVMLRVLVYSLSVLIYGVFGGCLWWMYGHMPAGWHIWLLPVYLVSLEFLLSFGPYGVWVSEGYLQARLLPLIPMVSITGIYGISFIIGLVASLWIALFYYSPAWTVLLPGILVVFAVFAFGIAQSQSPKTEQTVSIGLVVDSVASSLEGKYPEKEGVQAMEMYVQRLAEVADKGATVAILPEVALKVSSNARADFLAKFQAFARSRKLNIFLPFVEMDENWQSVNQMVVISEEGKIAGNYVKRYPLFGVAKKVQRGKSPPLIVELGGVRCGCIICHDDCFPRFVRYLGRNAVDIMVVPSKDWMEIALMHRDVSLFRAVENGCVQVRVTMNGYTQVVEPTGRILFSRSSIAFPRICEAVSIPLWKKKTLYPILGDIFAMANLILLIYFFWQAGLK